MRYTLYSHHSNRLGVKLWLSLCYIRVTLEFCLDRPTGAEAMQSKLVIERTVQDGGDALNVAVEV